MDWSQEQLATAANVSLSTVRDYEKERRGTSSSLRELRAIRQALEKENVHFMRSDGDFGPGVRLRAVMPNVLRWPVKLGRFESLLIPIEWRGQEVEVYLPNALLDDLGRFPKTQPEGEYLLAIRGVSPGNPYSGGNGGSMRAVLEKIGECILTHDDLQPAASAPASKSPRPSGAW